MLVLLSLVVVAPLLSLASKYKSFVFHPVISILLLSSTLLLLFNDDDTAEIYLAEAHHGVAPGQAAVFYQGDRVLGGGWIVGAERAA